MRFLQLWIQPDAVNTQPTYADRSFEPEARRDRWCLVAAPDGRDGALPIRQDIRISAADLAQDRGLDYALAAGRRAWLQVVTGAIDLNGEVLIEGDGAAISDVTRLAIRADADATLLLLDLP